MTENERSRFDDILEEIDLTQEPPEEEPARQYYFIKKCREIVRKKSEELGRPLCAATVTFGCQMNAGSEIIKTA